MNHAQNHQPFGFSYLCLYTTLQTIWSNAWQVFITELQTWRLSASTINSSSSLALFEAYTARDGHCRH